MQKQILLVLGLLVATSCKKDTVDYYAFPDEIFVSKDTCLEVWQDLEFRVSNSGSKIVMYSVYAWVGTDKDSIQVNPNKFDYSSGGSGFRFYIPRTVLGSNSVIFVRLEGHASDRGSIGNSKIYRFKKVVTNECVRWSAF